MGCATPHPPYGDGEVGRAVPDLLWYWRLWPLVAVMFHLELSLNEHANQGHRTAGFCDTWPVAPLGSTMRLLRRFALY